MYEYRICVHVLAGTRDTHTGILPGIHVHVPCTLCTRTRTRTYLVHAHVHVSLHVFSLRITCSRTSIHVGQCKRLKSHLTIYYVISHNYMHDMIRSCRKAMQSPSPTCIVCIVTCDTHSGMPSTRAFAHYVSASSCSCILSIFRKNA